MLKNIRLNVLLSLVLTGCSSNPPMVASGGGTDTNKSPNTVVDESRRYKVPDAYSYAQQPPIVTASKAPSLPRIIDIYPTKPAPTLPTYSRTTSPAPYYSKGIPAKTDTQTSAGNPSSYSLWGKDYKVLPFSNGFVERGIASWYGPDFHGKKTSNGETYNMYGMTAAHKRLPIPSYVKVTNLKNGRHVVLRINDRGPFHNDRVIDLSYAAAQKLDVHDAGTEMVQVEAINSAQGNNHESIYLQLGVFNSPDNARNLQAKVVANQMPQPRIKQVYHEGRVVYKVQLGPLYSTAKVDEFNLRLARIGVAKTRYVTETVN